MIDLSTPARWQIVRPADYGPRRDAQLRQCQYAAEKAKRDAGGCPCESAYCCPFRREVEQIGGAK